MAQLVQPSSGSGGTSSNPAASQAAPSTAPAANRDTPAMRQYQRFKDAHPDCILFFRMGDFYEMFDSDAVTAHKALGITLTERTSGIPMAGVPHHAAESYLRRLVDMGHRVAVCEQLQDPKDAKGVVERGVVRVITPGTRVDESLLDERVGNQVAAVALDKEGNAAVASVELSTGRFEFVFSIVDRVADELAQIAPAELLLAECSEAERDRARRWCSDVGAALTERPGWFFRSQEACDALKEQYGTASLRGLGLEQHSLEASACGALLRYLRGTQSAPAQTSENTQPVMPSTGSPCGSAGGSASSAGSPALRHLSVPMRLNRSSNLIIDSVSLRALEIERTMRTGALEGSLLGAMQECRSPAGKRLLREWLCAPLRNLTAIQERQEVVAAFLSNERFQLQCREALGNVQDLARVCGRCCLGRATPRDLVAVLRSLRAAQDLVQRMASHPALAPQAAQLAALLAGTGELSAQLGLAVVDAPPSHIREGGVIRTGFDPQLDSLRVLEQDADAWLAKYQATLASESGIDSLRVGYNRVFGYYIEVSTANSARVPDSFRRKQTLRNAERYETEALKDFEFRVLGAQAQALERERTLYTQLVESVARSHASLVQLSDRLAEIDVLQCFAACARRGHWCRPEVMVGRCLEVHEGRHPVLERILRESFVANDCFLGTSARKGASTTDDGSTREVGSCSATLNAGTLALITGPNMAGKSTFIRQNALLVLLAHCGSFVPAASARIGLVDRIFTRLGSADELHEGQSTFMVEMTETANILNHATPESMVVLDEVGRGTGTLDGLSLAWAIAETLARIGCRSLFATHYHEITTLADSVPAASNLHVAVREWNDRIIFLHQIRKGSTDKSYGIHVATIAGVPPTTVTRAREILESLSVAGVHLPASAADGTAATAGGRERFLVGSAESQLSLFPNYIIHPAVEALQAVDLDQLTPLAAFDLVRGLVDQCRGAEPPKR